MSMPQAERREDTASVFARVAMEVPPPPAPEVVLGVVGLGRDAVGALRALGPMAVRSCTMDDTDVAALIVAPAADLGAFEALTARRSRGDGIPVIATSVRSALDANVADAISRAALRAGAFHLLALPDRPELDALAACARAYAMKAPQLRDTWVRDRLAPWIRASLRPLGITPRRAEVIAHHALGATRKPIAAAMGISLKQVDELIALIHRATGQTRLIDVAAPFARALGPVLHGSPVLAS
ncbi:hypothetical protein [Sandaracinus amylolyticus]|uniref:hypothetical protein n=1 Tax=Sandaracinus amylolyticus TaxID=927083 RepID=UPI0012ECEB6C|nr:hypothetical protein [Sandaracinus amylolyticus]